MQTIAPYKEPKHHAALRYIASRARWRHDIALITLGVIACLLVLVSVVADLDPQGPFELDKYQCQSTGEVYDDLDYPLQSPCHGGAYRIIRAGEVIPAENFSERLLSNIEFVFFSGEVWILLGLLVTLLLRYTLFWLSLWHVAHTKKRYMLMKTRAEEGARQRLYAVAVTSANTRSVWVLCHPVDDLTSPVNLRFNRKNVNWTPGKSPQAVGWLTGAFYDEAGRLQNGPTVLIMSSQNEHNLPEVPVDTAATVEQEKLDCYLEMINKL